VEITQVKIEHMKLISLPSARHDWINLMVQDHPTIAAYNNELFWTTSQMAVCLHPIPNSELIFLCLSILAYCQAYTYQILSYHLLSTLKLLHQVFEIKT
jgi:hypothetical protein